MSNNSLNSISSKESISSSLESSIKELADVVNSSSASEPAIDQMNKEISDYEQIIDSDTFYKDNGTDSKSNNVSASSVTENFHDTNSSFSKWCVILLVIVFMIIGFLYFMKLRKEKNKLKNK